MNIYLLYHIWFIPNWTEPHNQEDWLHCKLVVTDLSQQLQTPSTSVSLVDPSVQHRVAHKVFIPQPVNASQSLFPSQPVRSRCLLFGNMTKP